MTADDTMKAELRVPSDLVWPLGPANPAQKQRLRPLGKRYLAPGVRCREELLGIPS